MPKRILLLLAALAPSIPLSGAEDPSVVYFRNLAETRSYSAGQPRSATVTSDGSAVVFLRSGPRDSNLLLYELNISTGVERELVTPEAVLAGKAEVLTPEEKAHRERTRNALRGFTSFEMTKGGTRLLVTVSGKLFVVNRADAKVTALPGDHWISPHFSPNGAYVAAVKSGELSVIDISTLAVRQLTTGATETLTHGAAEFIAQEEMDRFDGFWWSPDSLSIAYQETDESTVEDRYIADPMNPADAPLKAAYPHAGSANAKVRLGVVPVGGGATTWVPWDADKFPYLARVSWGVDGAPLTILVEDRHQRDERLLSVDTATGATHELLAETDTAWLNLVEPGFPRWLNGGRQFLWTTEKRGAWQLELHDATGALANVVTPLDLGYRSLAGVDEAGGLAYVEASLEPTESHLWKVPLSGKPGTQLTHNRGVHTGHLSDDGRELVHTFSLTDGSTGTELLSPEGKQIALLKSVAEAPLVMPRIELTRVGPDSLCAAVLRPTAFMSGIKYPVILSVYGGPQVTFVTSAARSYFTDQWLADQGYIVVRIDGRGTTLRGHDWQRLMKGNFIDMALHEQVEGLKALGSLYPEMDMSRVGVTGWSFGGYFSAMATIRRPDIFKAGVAGAPVVTWENYDTHYTEHYIGLPQENPEGYKASSVLTYAAQLSRPLLIIHGLTDDNVYFQHSVELADALFLAGKPYEFMPMLGTHMAGADSSVIRLREEQRVLLFFNRNL
jgi:dipeptidyl-peptidase-4